jgi:PAS domain S-box-containing protein
MLDDADILRRTLESTPVGLYVVDRDRKILLWSDGAERITGYRRQEVIGQSCKDGILIHCDQSGACLCDKGCTLSAALLNGRAPEAILFLKHRHGHRVPVRVHSVAIRNGRGAVIGALQAFHEQTVVTRNVGPNGSATLTTQTHASSVVPTRPLTLALLREALAASRAQMIGCGVACIQVAQFQEFKSTHALAAANQIMDSIAGTIREMLRQADLVGRWSESQLLVVLPGCQTAALEAVATRLARLAHQARIRWWGDDLSANVWIGAVMARPDETPDEVAARAAKAAEACAQRSANEDVVLIEN